MGEKVVKVEDVSIKFNLSKNKENRLKEYFINMIKGQLFFEEFWALKNISFELEKGDSLALIGVNGSGKSTLLRIIAGIIKPSTGIVQTNGSIAPLIAISGAFDGNLTARENIYLSGSMHGHSKKFIQERFDEIIDFSELQDFVDVPVRNFSSGMVSRLGFAVATMVKPDILIADEVLSVGDAKFRLKCEKRMSEMLSDGTTILFVSHSTAQAKKVCKNALWIDKGQAKMIGSSEEVCNAYSEFLK